MEFSCHRGAECHLVRVKSDSRSRSLSLADLTRAWFLFPFCVLTSPRANCYLQTLLPLGSFLISSCWWFSNAVSPGHSSTLLSLSDQDPLLLSDGFSGSLAWLWRSDFASKMGLNCTWPPEGSQSHLPGLCL